MVWVNNKIKGADSVVDVPPSEKAQPLENTLNPQDISWAEYVEKDGQAKVNNQQHAVK